jgi:hypothetical protein
MVRDVAVELLNLHSGSPIDYRLVEKWCEQFEFVPRSFVGWVEGRDTRHIDGYRYAPPILPEYVAAQRIVLVYEPPRWIPAIAGMTRLLIGCQDFTGFSIVHRASQGRNRTAQSFFIYH